MKLKNRYQRQKTYRSSSILQLIASLALFFFVSSTMARYLSSSYAYPQIVAAKWDIAVNGEYLSYNTGILTTPLTLYNTSGVAYTKINPGDTGYIEIVLDPTNTEVSLAYELTISFLKNATTSEDMLFTSYTLNGTSKSFSNYTSAGAIIDDTMTSKVVSVAQKNKLDSTDVQTLRIFWQYNSNTLDLDSISTQVSAAITAKQAIGTVYGITYVLGGGLNSTMNPTTYAAGDVINLQSPTRTGYTFSGWYENYDSITDTYSDQIQTITNYTRDLTLYAKWTTT